MPELRQTMLEWAKRRLAAQAEIGVLPTLGSKELIAWLPTLVGAKRVLFPAIAYPTYDVGARLAGAEAIAVGPDPASWPAADLVWINSPGNPTGAVLDREQMAASIAWARANNALLASDECYLEFGWEATPSSILDVAGEDVSGLLAVHSMSKRSNLAGYRAGLIAGDAAVTARLLELRRHAGMILSAPVQHAMMASLTDDEHVRVQRDRYAHRRALLRPALEKVGFRIEASHAGIYLWATRDESAWTSIADLARQGILAAPGSFYGSAGDQHIRVALTATDERVAAAVARLG
jgi:succinyldiaminopimelate transaminase